MPLKKVRPTHHDIKMEEPIPLTRKSQTYLSSHSMNSPEVSVSMSQLAEDNTRVTGTTKLLTPRSVTLSQKSAHSNPFEVVKAEREEDRRVERKTRISTVELVKVEWTSRADESREEASQVVE